MWINLVPLERVARFCAYRARSKYIGRRSLLCLKAVFFCGFFGESWALEQTSFCPLHIKNTSDLLDRWQVANLRDPVYGSAHVRVAGAIDLTLGQLDDLSSRGEKPLLIVPSYPLSGKQATHSGRPLFISEKGSERCNNSLREEASSVFVLEGGLLSWWAAGGEVYPSSSLGSNSELPFIIPFGALLQLNRDNYRFVMLRTKLPNELEKKTDVIFSVESIKDVEKIVEDQLSSLPDAKHLVLVADHNISEKITIYLNQKRLSRVYLVSEPLQEVSKYQSWSRMIAATRSRPLRNAVCQE